MKKISKAQQTIESDAFKRLEESCSILLIDLDDQIIQVIKYLICGANGNAEQLSRHLLKQAKQINTEFK